MVVHPQHPNRFGTIPTTWTNILWNIVAVQKCRQIYQSREEKPICDFRVMEEQNRQSRRNGAAQQNQSIRRYRVVPTVLFFIKFERLDPPKSKSTTVVLRSPLRLFDFWVRFRGRSRFSRTRCDPERCSTGGRSPKTPFSSRCAPIDPGRSKVYQMFRTVPPKPHYDASVVVSW